MYIEHMYSSDNIFRYNKASLYSVYRSEYNNNFALLAIFTCRHVRDFKTFLNSSCMVDDALQSI